MPRKSLFRKVFNVILLKLHLYKIYYRSLKPVRDLLNQFKSNNKYFDLIISNDIESLPVALLMANGTPVLLDSHEYSPEEWGGRLWKFVFSRYKDWQCKTYLPKVNSMSTVCQGIADKYMDNYGVNAFITLNAPNYLDITPSSIDAQCIHLVHHGAAQESRGLDTMIDMMALLDEKYVLHFYLMASSPSQLSYLEYLKDKTKSIGGRIYFHDPVETAKISSEINQYDIGVYPLMPLSTNERFALPNKFFEFIQARLAVVIGPSIEMQKIVNEKQIGEVAKDFTAFSMAEVINNLTVENIVMYKDNSNKAAKALSFESQSPVFLEKIKGLLGESE